MKTLEEIQQKRREYYALVRDKKIAYAREYVKVNKDRVRTTKKLYTKARKDRFCIDETKVNLGCAFCGFREYPEGLCFHHVDPKTKAFGLNAAGLFGRSVTEVKTEMAKCVVLCATHHAGLHAGRIELKAASPSVAAAAGSASL